jgi:hypothetical protein
MRIYVKKNNKMPVYVRCPTFFCTNIFFEKIIKVIIRDKTCLSIDEVNKLNIREFLLMVRKIKRDNPKLCLVDVTALDGTKVKIIL